jgi:hypothetical protein
VAEASQPQEDIAEASQPQEDMGEASQPQEDMGEASQPREEDEKAVESYPLISTCLLLLCVTGLFLALKLS